MTNSEWTLDGSNGEPIFGVCHEPNGEALGVALVCHGFKGYMDYGMFPCIAQEFAQAGFVAHRFNFSHSGMTRNIETFERPDLFEHDTWNKQVHDLQTVMRAVGQGELAGAGLPMIVFGHSRGGVTTLLTVGRGVDDSSIALPAGLIVAAAPSACCSMNEKTQAEFLAQGFQDSPSARTGQALRVGKIWLQEQLDDLAGHNLRSQVANIQCPVLIAHGTDDPSVPVSCAAELKDAIGAMAQTQLIEGANHVFNTPNPMPSDEEPSEQLAALLNGMIDFSQSVCAGATAS